MAKSKYGKLNWQDFLKGLGLSVSSAILASIQQIVAVDGNFDNVSYKGITTVALITLIAYLGKNLSTNSEDKLLTKEPKKTAEYEANFNPDKFGKN